MHILPGSAVDFALSQQKGITLDSLIKKIDTVTQANSTAG